MMVSYYTVVEYHPGPFNLSGERINIGVITFADGGDGTVYCRFLKNWKRVEQFGAHVDLDISYLHDFVHNASQLDEKKVRRMIDRWSRSIQLTPLRAGLLSPEDLLADVAKHCLVEPT